MNRFGTTPDYHTPFASYKNGAELRRQLETMDWGNVGLFTMLFQDLCSILGKTPEEGLDLGTTEKEIRSDDFRFVVQKTHERVVGTFGNNDFSAVVDDGVNFRQALSDLKMELIAYFRGLGFEPEHGNNGLMNPFDDLVFKRSRNP